jgi:hypothetical protein
MTMKNYKTLFFLFMFLSISVATAGGRIGAYFIYMSPYGSSATDFSNPGIGVGIRAVVPIASVDQICAFVIGGEVVDLASKTFDVHQNGNNYQQTTTQSYSRFLLGVQVGGYNDEMWRPYAGLHLAVIHYRVDDELIYPDDTRENLGGSGKTIFGCDMTFGLNVNIHNVWDIDAGVRYIKSFSLPQQLGTSLTTVHPEYFQIYLGAGISLDLLSELVPWNRTDHD